MKNKVSRKFEVKLLRKRINELLELLEMSHSQWRHMRVNRVTGKGYDYEVNIGEGHKPSMKQQYSLLFDLYTERQKNKELIDELKEKAKAAKENV